MAAANMVLQIPRNGEVRLMPDPISAFGFGVALTGAISALFSWRTQASKTEADVAAAKAREHETDANVLEKLQEHYHKLLSRVDESDIERYNLRKQVMEQQKSILELEKSRDLYSMEKMALQKQIEELQARIVDLTSTIDRLTLELERYREKEGSLEGVS